MDEDTGSQDRQPDQDLSDYAGRWVALVGDQVAGVGETAMAAERLGRRNRLRERLAIYFVEPRGGKPLLLPDQLLQLQSIFARHEQPVHLVGGAVRDVILNRPIKDLDFVAPQGAIRLAFKVADSLGLPAYVLDRERDAGRVVLADGETTLDFVCYRGDDLLSDLRGRDFTMNAMALPVAARTQASIIDPCDGLGDLAAGLIRQTHASAVDQDPVRAMRAVRHAVDFEFVIEKETRLAVRRAVSLLDGVSIERVRDELLKMMGSQYPERALILMSELSLLPVILPEIDALASIPQTAPHFESVLAHTDRVLACASQIEALVLQEQPPVSAMLAEAQLQLAPYRRQLAEYLERRLDGGVNGRQVQRLGALFHDSGKAQTLSVEADGRIRFFDHAGVGASLTGKRLSNLRLSKEVIRNVKMLVAGHMRPLFLAQNPTLSRRAIYRFFRDYGSAGIDITLLALADHLAIYGHCGSNGQWQRLLSVVSELHEHYFSRFTETVQPEPLVDGRALMEILQIDPGPEVGRLLDALVEAQAAGEVETWQEAIELLKRLATTEAE